MLDFPHPRTDTNAFFQHLVDEHVASDRWIVRLYMYVLVFKLCLLCVCMSGNTKLHEKWKSRDENHFLRRHTIPVWKQTNLKEIRGSD